jgi:hypothetical protein
MTREDVIAALNNLVEVESQYTSDWDSSPEARSKLIEASYPLIRVLWDYNRAMGYPTASNFWELKSGIEGHIASLLHDDYTDSDTDAMCDWEFCVHKWLEELDPNYHFDRKEIMQAFVSGMAVYHEEPNWDEEDE